MQMDEIEAKALAMLRQQVGEGSQGLGAMAAPGTRITFTSAYPFFMADTCWMGYAGYRIVLRGRELSTVSYADYDSNHQRWQRGMIDDDQERELQAICDRWDVTSQAPRVPWEGAPEYCGFEVAGVMGASFAYGWGCEVREVPACVAELVEALRRMRGTLPLDPFPPVPMP